MCLRYICGCIPSQRKRTTTILPEPKETRTRFFDTFQVISGVLECDGYA